MTKSHVIALHCSGGNARQWRALSQTLGRRVWAPDFIGSRATGHWGGEHPFTLADEAAPVISMLDALSAPVHLVGHSYGGAVALKVACARPAQVASLALYEPTPLHVLKAAGPDAQTVLAGVAAISAEIDRAVLAGDHRTAARAMVEYWNEPGAWAAMREDVQADMIRYVPKACLDFRAVVSERTPLAAYRHLRCPALVMQGEHAHEAAQVATRQIGRALRFASLRTVFGAGHMGPLTHAETVTAMLAEFIRRQDGDDMAQGDMEQGDMEQAVEQCADGALDRAA